MKIKNLKATSIVESMVTMLIVVTGVVGMYNIFTQSQKLSATTKYRIEAIQIAREGIEAMTNVRNTNRILYAADNKNCWNVLNYNNNCIGNKKTSTDISPKSYTIYKNSNNRWVINSKVSANSGYIDSTYRDNFKVTKDSDLFYTQSGGISFNPSFTREIKVEYIDTDNIGGANSNDEKMKITSLVQWLDSSSDKAHSVKLETILSNWKDRQ